MRTQEISIGAPRTTPVAVSVSGTHAESAVLAAGDHVYVCDVNSYIVFGTAPVATTSHLLVPMYTMLRIVGVQAGEKISIIAGSAGTAQLYPAI